MLDIEMKRINSKESGMTIGEMNTKLDDTEKLKMRNSLLEYCKLDTLAMVKILDKLKEVIDD
jgi:hypothetical protein